MEIVSKNPNQTKQLGIASAKKLASGDVVACYGDLGSGKTTFIQGLLEGLGIQQRVTSPTFVLVKMYRSAQKQTIFHLDLYRLEDSKQVEGLGFSDMLEDKNSICIIEWPEKIADLLPKKTKEIRFTKKTGDERRIHADWRG